MIPPVDKGRGFQHRVGTSMEFRQCSKLVGRDGALGSIVYIGFGENFLVDFPAVTIRTADGDLPLCWKMVYPR